MAFFAKTMVLLFKDEGTYGVDPTPAANANAIVVENASFDALRGDRVTRGLLKSYLGSDFRPLANQAVGLSFQLPLAGAGAAGTAPKYGPLLKAAGLTETVNVGVDVQYATATPASMTYGSGYAYFYMAGNLHKMSGCRVIPRAVFPKGGLPHFALDVIGIYVPVAAAGFPAGVSYSGFQTPVVVNKDNTTFSLHGFSAVMESAEIALGSTVVFRDLVNSKKVEITDRAPSGRCAIESPALASKDYFAIAASSAQATAEGALQIVHGTVAGNIVQIDAPKAQIDTIKPTNSDGVASLDVGLLLNPNAGDDELKFTIK